MADDLLQDLVVKLSQADTFDTAENPYAYARRAAVNLAFSWIRTRRRDREQAVEDFDHPDSDPPVWSKLVRAEDIRRVLDHMEDLGDRDRFILAMRYFDEAGFDEIAQVIGGTKDQARALCHKAIRRLRTAMTQRDRSLLEPRTEGKP